MSFLVPELVSWSEESTLDHVSKDEGRRLCCIFVAQNMEAGIHRVASVHSSTQVRISWMLLEEMIPKLHFL